VLNQPRYQGRVGAAGARELRLRLEPRARALGAGAVRFSRLIAPSYADIFFNNCFKNGLLPIVLPEAGGRPPVRRGGGVPRLRS
jgi:3-isopropylmalate/(R)-2-methylmalate dehydratase small subunit